MVPVLVVEARGGCSIAKPSSVISSTPSEGRKAVKTKSMRMFK